MFLNIKDKQDVLIFESNIYENSIPELIKFLNECSKNETVLVGYNMLEDITQMWRAIKVLQKTSQKSLYDLHLQILQSAKQGSSLYPNDEGSKSIWNIYDLSYIKNFKGLDIKALQINMRWNNVDKISLKPDKEQVTEFEIMKFKIDAMKETMFVKDLFALCKEDIRFRNEITKEFNIKFRNDRMPAISKRIMLHKIAEAMGLAPYLILKLNMNENRGPFYPKDFILPKIRFKTRELKDVLNQYMNMSVTPEKNHKTNIKLTYRGINISMGFGGLHGAKPGLYKSNKYYTIKSIDAKSFYANLAIANNFTPSFFPSNAFVGVLKSFQEKREECAPGSDIEYMYKELLTSAYGLSNAQGSFMRDYSYMLKCTINGQLLLLMLTELICEKLLGARPLLINTDGLEFIIPRDQSEKFDSLCNKFQEIFSLHFKHETYKMLVVANVSNILAIKAPVKITEEEYNKQVSAEDRSYLVTELTDQHFKCDIKQKGIFNTNKALNQDSSYKIIALALYNYFVHKKQVEDTIRECKDIFQFLAIAKSLDVIRFNDEFTNQDIVRYYKSTDGGKIHIKDNVNYKKNEVKGLETICNVINPEDTIDMYNIDYQFYIDKTQKELTKILNLLEI